MGLKSVVERLVVATGLAAYRRRRAGGTLILAYHNVVPDGHPQEGDRSLHLRRGAFAAQLDELCRTCDVVPLDESTPPGHPSGRPRVAITFDDCYQGSIAIGIPELTRRGLPATFFAAPGLLGRQTFWWDAIADTRSDGLTDVDRHHALTVCRGEADHVRRWATTTGRPWRPGSETMVSCDEADLRAAAGQPGITVGSHTWTHPNVTALRPEEVLAELRRTREWVGTLGASGRPDWISWPYGLCDGAATAAATQAGLRQGLRIDGGWHRGESAPLALPRLNVPAGLSLDGFRLRLAGFLAR